jgi:clan AA aspartic protease (TIGR02281 family)
MRHTTRRVVAALATAAAVTATAAVAGAPETVRLVQSGRGWVAEARLNDRVAGRFLIDTGATSCAITPLLAGQLGLYPPARHTDVETAAGTVRAGVVRLRSVAIGSRRAEAVQALVLDELERGIDGVLGLNFLDRFTYAIDPKRRLLELR